MFIMKNLIDFKEKMIKDAILKADKKLCKSINFFIVRQLSSIIKNKSKMRLIKDSMGYTELLNNDCNFLSFDTTLDLCFSRDVGQYVGKININCVFDFFEKSITCKFYLSEQMDEVLDEILLRFYKNKAKYVYKELKKQLSIIDGILEKEEFKIKLKRRNKL